jgi:rhamnosyltransferase subunit B
VLASSSQAVASLQIANLVNDFIHVPRSRPIKPKTNRSPRIPVAREKTNTTETLTEMGFLDRGCMKANLTAWLNVIDTVKPDLIVADLAPMASLAAIGRVPTICVGNGYFVPMLVDGYFSPDGNIATSWDCAQQDKIFANCLNALSTAKREASNIPQALCGDTGMPACLPALDPRYALRQDTLLPPEMDIIPTISHGTGTKIFAYFGDDWQSHLAAIVALSKCVSEASLFIPNTSGNLSRLPNNIHIRAKPFSAEEISATASLVVHHGGAGMTHLAALTGVPQIVAYFGPERWNNVNAIWSNGAGSGLQMDKFNAAAFSAMVQAALGGRAYRDAAQAWAHQSHDWVDGRRGQDEIADRILAIQA